MGVTHKKRVAESFEHKRMKQYMFENLHANNNIKRMELEYNVKSRRADLYGELIDGKKFVIEFQNSKISVAEIVERTKLYNENNMFVLWILNGVSYKRTPQNEDEKYISIEEDRLHRMYKGRVYYMNMTKQGLESFILFILQNVLIIHLKKGFFQNIMKNAEVLFVVIHPLWNWCLWIQNSLSSWHDSEITV